MFYYTHHIGDFQLQTSYFSRLECAIYREMIDYYLGSESPIPDPDEQVFRRMRITTLDERAAFMFVLTEKFELRDGNWFSSQLDQVLSDYRERAATNRENGGKGGRPRNPEKTQSVISGFPVGSQSEPSRNPIVTLTNNHKPTTNNQQPLKTKPLRDESLVSFDSFWSAYPKKQGKHDAMKAMKAAKLSDADLAKVLADLRRRSTSEDWLKDNGKYIPLPATYIRGRRWEDEAAIARPVSNIGVYI